MSGSTKVCKTQMYYLICMETPCISFHRNPLLEPGQIDNTERDYHDRAKRKFEAYLSGVVPDLDEFIESIILDCNDRYNISRYAGATQELYEWHLSDPDRDEILNRVRRLHVEWGMYMEITFSTIPSELVLSELKAELVQFFKQYDASKIDNTENEHPFRY